MGSYKTTFQWLKSSGPIIDAACDVLIVPAFQQETKEAGKGKGEEKTKTSLKWDDTLKLVDKAMAGALKEALDAEKFKGDCGKRRVLPVRKSDGVNARWVVVLGLGLPTKLEMQKAINAFANAHKDTYGFDDVQHSVVVMPKGSSKLDTTQMVQALVFGATQSTYKTKEAGEKKIHKLQTVEVALSDGKKLSNDVLQTAQWMALAEAMAKDLANRPANLKTAEDLAQAAREMSKLPNISVSVVSDQKTIQKTMPAFWAVGQAASKIDPLRFITVHYTPTKKPKKKIALVGKGVIFDTGGVQVKTGNYMNDMKFDMTGAATVLAAIRAAAEIGLKGINISAYVAAAQNLVGEEAYLPDSIIDSASGKKIEIRHTDAEGRVTLADSVHFATKDEPDEIITIATLTGSAAQAVGHCTALMGTDEGLLNRIDKAGKSVGEKIQKLDLFEEDFDNVKSDRDSADYSNVSKSRYRGHMSAGAFVINFAKGIPAAHMDIAGGDAKDGNATGIAVKGLIQFLRNESN